MVKKFAFIIFLLTALSYFLGCSKKEQSVQDLQEPLSLEALSSMSNELQTTSTTKLENAKQSIVPFTTQVEPTSTVGPKPTVQEIQTALKNANFYTGQIDGKKGSLTKKAIEEFQRANGLEVDGKVGPKTWAVLSASLNPPVVETKTKKR